MGPAAVAGAAVVVSRSGGMVRYGGGRRRPSRETGVRPRCGAAVAEASPFPPLPRNSRSRSCGSTRVFARTGSVLMNHRRLRSADRDPRRGGHPRGDGAGPAAPRVARATGGARPGRRHVWLNVQRAGPRSSTSPPRVHGPRRRGRRPPDETLSYGDRTGSHLSNLFAVVSGSAPLPANNPRAVRKAWTDFPRGRRACGRPRACRPPRWSRRGGERLYDLPAPSSG